jgi:hypothetical protein
VRDHIPDAHIVLVECSQMTIEEQDYFVSHVDRFINLYDDVPSRNAIHSSSKSLGEGTMTIHALQYILNSGIEFTSMYKLSGRYWITERFDYSRMQEPFNFALLTSGVSTRLYKLRMDSARFFLTFLNDNMQSMVHCIGYESLFHTFLKSLSSDTVNYVSTIGVAGYISVSGDVIDE